jgi:hypothetical protein
MNQTETEKLLTIIQRSYPNHFKEFDSDVFEAQTRLWQRSLADYSYRDIAYAFEMWINTQKFPPTLAEFKHTVVKLSKPTALLSPETAWETVSNAVRKYGSYGQERAFATFSEPIKRAVRNVGGWQKICQTELGQPWDFLRKNFLECYKDFSTIENQQYLLPESVLHQLQQMTDQKQLESKK